MFKKFTVSSLYFIAFVAFLFAGPLNLRLWQFALEHTEPFDFSSFKMLIAFFFILFALFYACFSILFLPKIGKPVVALFVFISVVTQFLMLKYGIFIDREMVQNLFETNLREAADFITPLSAVYVLCSAGIPLLLIFGVKVSFASFLKEFKSRVFVNLMLLFVAGVLALFSYKDIVAFGRNNRLARSLINTTNYTTATIRYLKKMRTVNHQFVTLDKDAQTKPEFQNPQMPVVLVLVVGETARADNFSLGGYEKETNPLLQKQDIIYFQDVYACGTSTAVSVPCLFSNKPRTKFKVEESKYTENLLDVLAHAGYDIIWKENDDGCKYVCDRVQKTENLVKTNRPEYCFGKYCQDEVFIPALKSALQNITQNTVIVLHTMGSHGPSYFLRYPQKFKTFTPTCESSEIDSCTQEQIVNTYNNTLVYTDYVLDSLIQELKQHQDFASGLIYVSDHGESLGENNIYLHAMPYLMAPQGQKKVPMLFWLSKNLKSVHALDEQRLRQNARSETFSHDNFYHTVLGLAGVQSKTYQKDLDILKK